MTINKPTIRWGILGTGWVSTSFTTDFLTPRSDAKAHHVFQALGTSSQERGHDFVKKVFEGAAKDATKPKIYTSYQDVYDDPDVDVVYVGTPHSLHKENCLSAIAANKHVLCEKPMTINAAESEVVIEAAKDKGVFLMEAVWIRFFPIVLELQRLVHEEKIIGEPYRMFCDFGLELHLEDKPPSNRYKDPALGGGALLDIGIYPLTWASLLIGTGLGTSATHPTISASMVLVEGVDYSDSITLTYPSSPSSPSPRTAICTSTVYNRTAETFCRIEGSKGVIKISGPAASVPRKITIKRADAEGKQTEKDDVREFEPEAGVGFMWEADAVALDVAGGRKENAIMPVGESLRMMRLMDDIRKICGLKYPQDSA